MKGFGTISFGVKAPIIKQGDNLVEIVANSVLSSCEENGIKIEDKDIVGVTEAIVARAQGNYANINDIAFDVSQKFKEQTVGLIFPILSRNRFSSILKGIAKGVKKLVIQLSYPNDEVGNPLISIEKLHSVMGGGYNNAATYTAQEFYHLFGEIKHPFTGVDYIDFYQKLAGKNCEIILSNNPLEILKHTKYVINADIHSRFRTKKLLLQNGAKKVVSLHEILNKSVNGSGYHKQYGLLGSNLATDEKIKLFPRDCDKFVEKLSKLLYKKTGKTVECLVYGDGAFKDPVGGIWELADPVVSPAYTNGLIGTPNEVKLKYLADNKLGNVSGQVAIDKMKMLIKNKEKNLVNKNESLGTTPRQLTDLIGSLCDLTSGSGDKGTPIVYIKGYFKNFADED